MTASNTPSPCHHPRKTQDGRSVHHDDEIGARCPERDGGKVVAIDDPSGFRRQRVLTIVPSVLGETGPSGTPKLVVEMVERETEILRQSKSDGRLARSGASENEDSLGPPPRRLS